jgi:hypothetical protein
MQDSEEMKKMKGYNNLYPRFKGYLSGLVIFCPLLKMYGIFCCAEAPPLKKTTSVATETIARY